MLYVKQLGLAVMAVMALSVPRQVAGGEFPTLSVDTSGLHPPDVHVRFDNTSDPPPTALQCVPCPGGKCDGQTLKQACTTGACFAGKCFSPSGRRDTDAPEARELNEPGRRADTWCLAWDTNDPEGKSARACESCNGPQGICN